MLTILSLLVILFPIPLAAASSNTQPLPLKIRYVIDEDFKRLQKEYGALEIRRQEGNERALEWLNAEKDNLLEFKQKKICISLGSNCAASRQFVMKKLSEAFFPFDWSISQVDSIYKALGSGFKDFLKLENLTLLQQELPAGTIGVRDTLYNIDFVHDFKNREPLLSDYAHVKAKYYRRIDRFYRALSLGKEVFFFRTVITKQEAKKLSTLIQKKFPNLKYTLVVINDTDEFKKPWKLKNLRNYFLNRASNPMMVDRVNLHGWEKIFLDLKLIKPKSKRSAQADRKKYIASAPK